VRAASCLLWALAFHFLSSLFSYFSLQEQEQEQDAPATQELPYKTNEAIQEVTTDVADVKEASEDVKAPPPSSETSEGLAEEEAPLFEEKKEVKTTNPPSTEPESSKEVLLEEAPEPAAAPPSKPAKKPLVGRKPLAAKKVRDFRRCASPHSLISTCISPQILLNIFY